MRIETRGRETDMKLRETDADAETETVDEKEERFRRGLFGPLHRMYEGRYVCVL